MVALQQVGATSEADRIAGVRNGEGVQARD